MPEGTMAEEEEDIREAIVGHTTEAAGRLTTAIILETLKLVNIHFDIGRLRS
jgi:hypothetical protein